MLKDTIKDAALDLDIDESKQISCPICQATHENSLSITRISEGILYNCFRAKCGAKGFVPSTYIPVKRKPKAFTPKPYTGHLTNLTPEIIELFNTRYDITYFQLRDNGIKWDEQRQRIYVPVFDIFGHEVGAYSKLLNPIKGEPKHIAYWYNEVPKIHYPKSFSNKMELFGDFVVLVEDQLSSIKMTKLIDTAAILGTSLDSRAAEQLAMLSRNIVIALDPDAAHKAVAIKRNYGLMFNRMEIMYLKQDPKETSYTELIETLTRVIYNGT